MTVSNEEILQLAKEDELTAQLVLTIDALADRVKDLSARIQRLEAGEQELSPAAKTLKLVHDGS